MYSQSTDLFNVAPDILSIIPHCVKVEASCSLGQDIIGWRQSKTTGDTFEETVVVRQFAWANNGILAGNYTALDSTETENDLELNIEVEERKLHRLAKVYDILEMWQGSQNLRATQKESHAWNIQMTAVWYISDSKEIIKGSWSNFQHDGEAAFKLSERSQLPATLSAMDLTGGRTQVLNVCRIGRIDHYSAKCDDDSAAESISDTENWLDCNVDLDDPNASDDTWEKNNKSDIKLDNDIDGPDSLGHWDDSAAPNVHWLIRPTLRSLYRA